MSAALQSPTADCSRTALRRLACVARLDGLRAGHPPFPRRRRQGQHDDHDRLARHHAGDRGPDDPRHARLSPGGSARPTRARAICPISIYSGRIELRRLVDPVHDGHAAGRRGLGRLARPRSAQAARRQTRRRSRSRSSRSTGNGCSSTPTRASQPSISSSFPSARRSTSR